MCYSFVQERQLNLLENMILFKPVVLQPGQGAGLGLYSERASIITIYLCVFFFLQKYRTFPLVVTKKIVELHGGFVSIASEGDGLGSAFTVRLPCLLPVEEELQAAVWQERDCVSPATLRLSFDQASPPVGSSLETSPEQIVDNNASPTGLSSAETLVDTKRK